jgi:hypothetical protein
MELPDWLTKTSRQGSRWRRKPRDPGLVFVVFAVIVGSGSRHNSRKFILDRNVVVECDARYMYAN